jgi:hypothetical protein
MNPPHWGTFSSHQSFHEGCVPRHFVADFLYAAEHLNLGLVTTWFALFTLIIRSSQVTKAGPFSSTSRSTITSFNNIYQRIEDTSRTHLDHTHNIPYICTPRHVHIQKSSRDLKLWVLSALTPLWTTHPLSFETSKMLLSRIDRGRRCETVTM